MGFYDEMQGIATSLLTEYNQGVIQISTISKTGTEWKPTSTPNAPITLKGTAVGASAYYISKGLAIQGDLIVTTEINAAVTPDMSAILLIDGVKYKIVSFQVIPPAGTPVVWKFIVRKA